MTISNTTYSHLTNRIASTATLLKPHIHKTPIHTSQFLNDQCGMNLFLKCENFQRGGAFKMRGASNAVLEVRGKVKAVCTHSSGNHAQALAKAAQLFGLEAHIIMPKNAPQVKVNAVRDTYGAKVYFCEPNQQAREELCEKVCKEIGEEQCEFIHPYNDERVILGQSTCMYEFFHQLKNGELECGKTLEERSDEELPIDAILCPIGGGGLMSGTCLAGRLLTDQKLPIYGVEPEAANDAQRSLESGSHQKNESPPQTIGDGLLTNLGSITYPIVRDHVRRVFTANDDEARRAMKLVWERMKIIIEPSSAFAVAVALFNEEFRETYRGKRVGIIITGGNVDIKKVAEWF